MFEGGFGFLFQLATSNNKKPNGAAYISFNLSLACLLLLFWLVANYLLRKQQGQDSDRRDPESAHRAVHVVGETRGTNGRANGAV